MTERVKGPSLLHLPLGHKYPKRLGAHSNENRNKAHLLSQQANATSQHREDSAKITN